MRGTYYMYLRYLQRLRVTRYFNACTSQDTGLEHAGSLHTYYALIFELSRNLYLKLMSDYIPVFIR